MVSEETIRALAGHVSRKMMECYSHIRAAAREAAIAALEARNQADFAADFPQKSPQSADVGMGQRVAIFEKALN